MAVKTQVKAKTTTIGQYLLDLLSSYGVEHIFGVPGDYILQFDKLIENHQIAFINATRENTAGYMADAYARIRGLGVACTTYGVGINIANAVAQAYVEHSPLIVISGAAATEEFATNPYLHHMFRTSSGSLRDTTQMEIFRKITAAQILLDNPSTAQSQIHWAIEQCLAHKKPVYIEIPRDQVNQEIPKHNIQPSPHKEDDLEALEEVLEEAVHFLKNSSRPVIWVGHEVQRHQLGEDVIQFAEKYRIPIVSSLLGKTTVSEYHPLYIGVYQGKLSSDEVREYVETADTVFLFGVVLNEIETGMQTSELKSKQKILAISNEIKVNHHHYPHISMRSLIKGLGALDLNVRFRSNYPAYIDRVRLPFKAQKNEKITVQRFFDCLQERMLAEHLVVSDFGDALFGCSDLMLELGNFLSNPYFAALGFGIPATIGAAFGTPQKRVVGVVGDGAFQMTCTELSTAVRFGLDPVILVLNNHGYGTERPLLEGKYNNLLNWKYSKIPEIFGAGTGFFVKTEGELEQALDQALKTRGSFQLIEVELDENDHSKAFKRFSQVLQEKGLNSAS